jgi:hypothetical protein
MKQQLSLNLLPGCAVLITCSSHENRCLGFLSKISEWKPVEVLLFHYDDENPKREENHKKMKSALRKVGIEPVDISFTEVNPVKSLKDSMQRLGEILSKYADTSIILDISVFTKRHLLMMLRWLDDEGLWDRLAIVYSEPEDYEVSPYIPLSFGLSSLQQIPGFSACPNLSRSIHLVLFLGYEGDRALAVYEHIQPMRTTLVISHPPYNPEWTGRTEKCNIYLINLVGEDHVKKVDPIDPDETKAALVRIFDECDKWGEYAKIVCPLGTKPQTLGIYNYVRECSDPPAVVNASPLRHNHEFYTQGIGVTWLVKKVENL